MSLGAKHYARALEGGQAKIREQNADNRRGEFLRAIDGDEHANLNDWEIKFVSDFIKARAGIAHNLDFKWFTPGRRAVVDKMIQRYGFRSLRPVQTRMVPQVEPGHCGYLKHEEGRRNVPCNAPAVVKLQSGLELCAECDQTRKENLEKLRQFKTRNMR